MSELRNAQQEALREAEQLRAELNQTREQLAAKTVSTPGVYEARPAVGAGVVSVHRMSSFSWEVGKFAVAGIVKRRIFKG